MNLVYETLKFLKCLVLTLVALIESYNIWIKLAILKNEFWKLKYVSFFLFNGKTDLLKTRKFLVLYLHPQKLVLKCNGVFFITVVTNFEPMLVQCTPAGKNVIWQIIIWTITTLKISMGKLSTRKKCVFSLQPKMIPLPPTSPPQDTSTHIPHTHKKTTKTDTGLICENESSDIWRSQILASSTKITSVPAKISDNKIVITNGKQIFLFQITMFLRRNTPKILGC